MERILAYDLPTDSKETTQINILSDQVTNDDRETKSDEIPEQGGKMNKSGNTGAVDDWDKVIVDPSQGGGFSNTEKGSPESCPEGLQLRQTMLGEASEPGPKEWKARGESSCNVMKQTGSVSLRLTDEEDSKKFEEREKFKETSLYPMRLEDSSGPHSPDTIENVLQSFEVKEADDKCQDVFPGIPILQETRVRTITVRDRQIDVLNASGSSLQLVLSDEEEHIVVMKGSPPVEDEGT